MEIDRCEGRVLAHYESNALVCPLTLSKHP
jgi:hypothetical protein